jgi:hypothetical protein
MRPPRSRTGSAPSPRSIRGDGEDDEHIDRQAHLTRPADVGGEQALAAGHRRPGDPRRNEPSRSDRRTADRRRARGDRLEAAPGSPPPAGHPRSATRVRRTALGGRSALGCPRPRGRPPASVRDRRGRPPSGDRGAAKRAVQPPAAPAGGGTRRISARSAGHDPAARSRGLALDPRAPGGRAGDPNEPGPAGTPCSRPR